MPRLALKAVTVLVFVAVALGVVFMAVMGYPAEIVSRASEARSAGRVVPVHELDSIAQLRAGFNAEQSSPRLLLVLSPT